MRCIRGKLVVVVSMVLGILACSKEKPADEAIGKKSAELLSAYMKASNAKDAERLKSFYAEDVVTEYVDFIPATKVEGRDKLVNDTFKESWKAFPDAQFESLRVLIKGREIVMISLATGTNTGEIQGMPPTEMPIGILSGYHWKLNNQNKIAYETVFTDQSALPGQLGLLPDGQFRPAMERTRRPPKIMIATSSRKEQDNAKLIEKVITAFNSHDVDKVTGHYKDTAAYSYVPSPKDYRGKKKFAKYLAELYRMSSDIKATPEWIWGAEDYVAARTVVTGTNDGDLPGNAGEATNEQFENVELHIYKVVKGKITRQWTFANSMSRAVQLGLAQNPE